MTKTIRCPACRAQGEVSDERKYEIRGQWDGYPVRKCLRCGSGLQVKMIGKPKLIHGGLWRKMEAEWEKQFGINERSEPAPTAGPVRLSPVPATSPPSSISRSGRNAEEASPNSPSGWLDDPTGRFRLRYRENGDWTAHVSNGRGETENDHYPPPPPVVQSDPLIGRPSATHSGLSARAYQLLTTFQFEADDMAGQVRELDAKINDDGFEDQWHDMALAQIVGIQLAQSGGRDWPEPAFLRLAGAFIAGARLGEVVFDVQLPLGEPYASGDYGEQAAALILSEQEVLEFVKIHVPQQMNLFLIGSYLLSMNEALSQLPGDPSYPGLAAAMAGLRWVAQTVG